MPLSHAHVILALLFTTSRAQTSNPNDDSIIEVAPPSSSTFRTEPQQVEVELDFETAHFDETTRLLQLVSPTEIHIIVMHESHLPSDFRTFHFSSQNGLKEEHLPLDDAMSWEGTDGDVHVLVQGEQVTVVRHNKAQTMLLKGHASLLGAPTPSSDTDVHNGCITVRLPPDIGRHDDDLLHTDKHTSNLNLLQTGRNITWGILLVSDVQRLTLYSRAEAASRAARNVQRANFLWMTQNWPQDTTVTLRAVAHISRDEELYGPNDDGNWRRLRNSNDVNDLVIAIATWNRQDPALQQARRDGTLRYDALHVLSGYRFPEGIVGVAVLNSISTLDAVAALGFPRSFLSESEEGAKLC
ncbi:MAG: hypothetical protein MHM6MM_008418 [Cercozoa sp. M6MM]